MASPHDDRRPGGPFTLPPIAQMTRDMPQDRSPKHNSAPHEMHMRDSGMWSMQSPSKHSSTISSAYSTMSSNNGLQLQTILNSDDSPHRFSSASAASANTPASARMSRSSHPLPALNRSLTNDNNPRASIDANNTFFIDSRRSSIDSRSEVPFHSLNINNPASPHDSANPSHRASEASLASSFHQQAPTSNPGIPPPLPPKSSGPIPRRPLTSGGTAPKRAPAIAPHPRATGINPNASQPTKGHAWAFPDPKEEDEMADSISIESSRQGSMASGHMGSMDTSFGGLRHAASHHTLPAKTLTSLSGVDLAGAGNYSRTPELRVSHKLAERKRRSEMKDLFDNLNRILPNSPGNKSSKWEVLSKAVEYIELLKHSHIQTQEDNAKLRRELEQARTTADDNQALSSEITVMYQQICRLDPNGHKIFGPRTAQFADSDRQPPPPPPPAPQQQSQQGHRNHQPYAPMQGVEYGYDRR